MGMSVDANARKLMGGTGYLVQARVSVFNESNEVLVLSKSRANYEVKDRSNCVVTRFSEADSLDAQPVPPHSGTAFEVDFVTEGNMEEPHLLHVRAGEYTAHTLI